MTDTCLVSLFEILLVQSNQMLEAMARVDWTWLSGLEVRGLDDLWCFGGFMSCGVCSKVLSRA